jgi:hypothetical protein
MDESHVDGEIAAPEEVGHVGEKNGNIAGAAALDGLPGIGADKEGPVMKGVLVPGIQVRGAAVGVEMDQLHVLERSAGRVGLAPQGQCVDERLRESACALHVDPIARPNSVDGPFC